MRAGAILGPMIAARALALTLAALVVAACTPSGGEAGRGDARPPVGEDKMSEEAGSIGAAEVAEVAGDDAQGREFTGILDVERIAGGKRLQATTLECDDGETYILSYRPMLDHLDKIERRVIVRGETYAPEGQAVGGRHLRARSIHLAEGEAPAPVVEGALPVPPIARSGAEARARVGRWVQIVGVLVGVKPGDDTWQVVILRLGDGVEVEITETRGIVDRVYRPHFGAQVTALGNLFAGEEGRLGLGRVALCAGEVDGCGMTTEAIRRF